MHTFGETGTGVPAFLAKLWRLVEDPETNNLICWSKDGRSFIIQNQAQFARELLPLNYKHNNMASFIRQLNMYGFHKITSIDNGGLKFDKDEMEFSHPCFKRNCPYLLEHIKRKIASSKNIDDKALKPEAVTKVLQDVKAMRGRQDSLDSRFSVMKQENEALWREIASLRQKHAKQQQIVNKLIQFLITIVQPTRNVSGVKRHVQLMINDTPENAKLCKSNDPEPDCGPVIHELGEELLEEVADTDSELMDTHSPYNRSYSSYVDNESPSPNMERPQSSISLASQNYDYSNQSAEDAINIVAGSSNNGNAPTQTSGNGMSIIQSVNPDGSKIIYHVTEVPESQSHDVVSIASPNYNEENVLTTPMVRKEMLKQKNKQRRRQPINSNAKVQRLEQPLAAENGATTAGAAVSNQASSEQIQVKSEHPDVNTMLFLKAFNDKNRAVTPDGALLSPHLSDDSIQSNVNAALIDNMGGSNASVSDQTQMFIPNNFISENIPANIFEDGSFIGTDSNDLNDLKASQQTITAPLSPYLTANNGNGNANLNNNNALTSTSGTVTTPLTQPISSEDDLNKASTSGTNVKRSPNGKKEENMALTKYKDSNGGQGGLRLSTFDEVHGHLENVQDELDSLKDLLRGDGYSLDANTLMGNGTTPNHSRTYFPPTLEPDFFNKLFSDSDILSPYGLSVPTDAANQKKGSELMSYQPLYDLSDIIDNNDLDTEAGAAISVNANAHQIPTSVGVGSGGDGLNTPLHN